MKKKKGCDMDKVIKKISKGKGREGGGRKGGG